jgi:hypothetical protein
MGIVDEMLGRRRAYGDGHGIDRELAINCTRRRLDDEVSEGVSDGEIWQLWQRHVAGPTYRDDLMRVVAELEGIALDG